LLKFTMLLLITSDDEFNCNVDCDGNCCRC
jgi:hypothetical protein